MFTSNIFGVIVDDIVGSNVTYATDKLYYISRIIQGIVASGLRLASNAD